MRMGDQVRFNQRQWMEKTHVYMLRLLNKWITCILYYWSTTDFRKKKKHTTTHQLFRPALHRASWSVSSIKAQPGPPHCGEGACVGLLQFLRPKCKIKGHPHYRHKWKSPSETFSEHWLIKLTIEVYRTRRKQKEDFPKHLKIGKAPKRQQAATIW